MTTPHRTLQMALDALDAITDDVDGTGLNTMPSFDKAIDAIAALREAMAADHFRNVAEKVAPAAPVVPLTDEQFADIVAEASLTVDLAANPLKLLAFAREVLKAYGITGGAQSAAPAVREPQPEVLQQVMTELDRATRKFPTWPTDPLHALAVLGEEFGELTKAMLQFTYEPHKKVSRADIREEAIQTAAMALRLAMSLPVYDYAPGPQHKQDGIGEAAMADVPLPEPHHQSAANFNAPDEPFYTADQMHAHAAAVSAEKDAEIERLRAEVAGLRDFVEHVRRNGSTHLANMAVAVLAARTGEA